MTDEQINKAIHERIMGDCWHKFEPYRAIHGNRKALFKLFKLSSRAEVVLEQFDPERVNEIYYWRRKMRPSMVNATEITLWLWPVLDDLTWFERLRIWIEGRWIALRDRCAKMFSRL